MESQKKIMTIKNWQGPTVTVGVCYGDNFDQGHNPEHLLRLSSLDVMSDQSGKLEVTP